MPKSSKLVKVTQMGQLVDDTVVKELKKRLELGRLAFISKECQKEILDLQLLGNRKTERRLDPAKVPDIWKLLIQSAVTFLKRFDPREWRTDWAEPASQEEERSLKTFGVEDLLRYFRQFSEFEKILYGAVDYYRGHTQHVFRVWMLGALLLDDMFQNGNHGNDPYIEFWDTVEEDAEMKFQDLISEQEIQAMWCIIALAHDLGYPLQKIEDINEQARAMLRQYAKVNLQDLNFAVPQQHQFINDFILRFISSRSVLSGDQNKEELKKQVAGRGNTGEKPKRIFRTHVQSKYYLKYSKSLEAYEHGIFSSIILMKNLTYFLESDYDLDELEPLTYEDARQCAIRREILRAVACHTCEDIYHIRPDTLGFMLVLCDELQTWGRPTFEEMQVATDVLPIATLNEFSKRKVDYTLELPGDKEALDKWAKKIFRRLHKMLRAAVDAPEREFACQVKVRSLDGSPYEYMFRFEGTKGKAPEFNFEINGVNWEPWDD